MTKKFGGKVLFLDRADINTDEIIPAKYLTENSKEALKPFLLEDLKLPGFNPEKDIAEKNVLITGENFGCGSSREHAPWALEVNDIYVVIAPSFARIFRQNMYNCGMLAIEAPQNTIDDLFAKFKGKNAECEVDVDASKLRVSGNGDTAEIQFSISGFDKALIQAGGWVEYADANY